MPQHLIRIARTITITQVVVVDEKNYPGMTATQAVDFERGKTTIDKLEDFAMELQGANFESGRVSAEHIDPTEAIGEVHDRIEILEFDFSGEVASIHSHSDPR